MEGRKYRLIKYLSCLALILSVVSVYWQVHTFDFINFDDYMYVRDNPYIGEGITFDGIKWAFTSFYAANWHPLTWLTHMADVELYGMKPGMHHLTNVFLHMANTLLLFYLLRRMTGGVWKSAVVALLFGLHPIHVESVAWVSERKDVFSTFFWMLTMLGYTWYIEKRSAPRYLVVAACYGFGLMAKPMLVTLPFVLLLMDFWPLRRPELVMAEDEGGSDASQGWTSGIRFSGILPLIVEKIPLFVLAAGAGVMTLFAQGSGGAVSTLEMIPLYARVENALISYMAYLVKMVWPLNLAVFYPYPKEFSLLIVAGSLLLIVLITLLSLWLMRRSPYLLSGWLWYLGTLMPVIGIIQVGSQSMADRYTYVPLVGIFVMIAWGIPALLERWSPGRYLLAGTVCAMVPMLMWSSWLQVGYWKDDVTLFSHALDVTENNYVAHNNLGLDLFDIGDVDGAIKHYQESLQINPSNPKVYINFGTALSKQGELHSAVEFYKKGLEIEPDNADAHAGLGTLMESMGYADEAVKHFNEALAIDHYSIEAHNNLGNLMLRKGKIDEAIRHYTNALKINSHQTEVYNNLGTAFIHKGNIRKAVQYFQKSLQEKPDYIEAAENLKNARINQSKLEETALKLQDLIKTDPSNPAIFTRLGNVYMKLGDYAEAISKYQEAISIQPEYTQALYGLVLVYSNEQEYTEALEVLEDMRQLQPDNPEIYYNIACIYAKQDMEDKTIVWLKKAIEKGFDNWDLLKEDPDLEIIRKTEYVIELMKRRGNV